MKQSIGLKRDTIDKYYTKKEIADLCVDFFKLNIETKKSDLIIEPSAGNGSFIDGIKSISDNYEFYDIEPEHLEIIKQNYLTHDVKELKDKFSKIHVIGNPPFGRQSSLAIQFIKKSCSYCDTLSFILPKSFKKDSLKKTFPLNFHLIFEKDIPDKSFLVNDLEINVPCVFQIWEKKNINRDVAKKQEPINFKFVKKIENPDISFRRVGVNAGTLSKEIINKSIQSHYFIKFADIISIDEYIVKLSNIKFDFNNTVGPKSISKQELIHKFNAILIV
jgi:predicted RNA methylase